MQLQRSQNWSILPHELIQVDSRWCQWGFFPWYPWQNHVPWGRLSLWEWVPGISPGVKAAGAFGWRPTTFVVPKRQEIRGLNLPGTPWTTSACRGRPLLTDTRSECVILIAFLWQQWLRERAYCYVVTYTACPVSLFSHLKPHLRRNVKHNY
jgi:hypothetical protein